MQSVECALQSQHKTFSDSRIQLRSDVNNWENKSRRPRSLALLTTNNCDLDEYGETKVLQRNGLSCKRIAYSRNNMKTDTFSSAGVDIVNSSHFEHY